MGKSEKVTKPSKTTPPEKSIIPHPAPDPKHRHLTLDLTPLTPIDIGPVDEGDVVPPGPPDSSGRAIPRVRGPKGIDWVLAKQVYVETDLPQIKIAHLLGCNLSSVSLRAVRDSWATARKAREREELEGAGHKRKELKLALEESQKTQEITTHLVKASLTIIVEDLREWHKRKEAYVAEHPGERFPEKMPLTPAGINALTSSMQRLELWDRAKLGGPDIRLEAEVKRIDLTALLDRASVVG